MSIPRWRCTTECAIYNDRPVALAGVMVESPNGEYVTHEAHVAAVKELQASIYTMEAGHLIAITAAVRRAKIDAVVELLGGISLEEHDRRIIHKNYDAGKGAGIEAAWDAVAGIVHWVGYTAISDDVHVYASDPLTAINAVLAADQGAEDDH